MRAYVRYYLKYPPNVLAGMTIKEMAEAFEDLLYVREQRSRYEPEE